ncbi:MAG: 30S ribosomal protein S16 [Fibromonadales bacterium]|nr:30S ribosomal protein S16 [Fibromonadales bacterium]
MAAVIRLSRFGKRHHPTYRVVVTDRRKARDGQFIEQLGFYDPNLKIADVRFEFERVMYWLGVGAQPSDTVRSLLKQQGIMALFHEKRAGRSIDGKTPVPVAPKAKKAKISRKAKARLEAEKAAAAAPPAEATAEAPAE